MFNHKVFFDVDSFMHECDKVKYELSDIYGYITEGTILRSKHSGIRKRKNQQFLSLEKRNKARSHLKKVIQNETTI